jgi:hypothetical protein
MKPFTVNVPTSLVSLFKPVNSVVRLPLFACVIVFDVILTITVVSITILVSNIIPVFEIADHSCIGVGIRSVNPVTTKAAAAVMFVITVGVAAGA